MRNDSMLKHHFPVAKPTVEKTDLRSMAANFDAIARGKVVVK